MINKLRNKIFWIIQGTVTIIIVGVIILYTVLSYRESITSATMFMDRLTGDDGRKMENSRNFDVLNETNNEDIYKIVVNNENEIIRKSNNTNEEVEKIAIEVSKNKKQEGFIDKYVYKTRRLGNNEINITLMENESAIKNINIKIYSSIIIAVILIFLIYIIAKKISKTIVKPVEETLEKQKQFISDASHELKTPLAVIEANSEVLEDKVGNNKWITYIQNEIQSMNKLVNDLLLLAKIENIKNKNFEKFNLSKQVELSISVFESMIFEKNINLTTNITDNIEFYGDKEDIKHIVSTLVDNAIKHTKEKKKIVVDLIKEKNEIMLLVKNEGEPIPEDEQEKIFERFYRVDKSRNRNEKRYGLGLAIAKQIVEKYNGTIEVNCKEGITCFTVKIHE